MAMRADAVVNQAMIEKKNDSLRRKCFFHYNQKNRKYHNHIRKDNGFAIRKSNVYGIRFIIISLISRLLFSSCTLPGSTFFSYHLWKEAE